MNCAVLKLFRNRFAHFEIL